MSRILLIDDEKVLVSLIESRLKANGHEVMSAYNGQEGIEFAKKQPKLIILYIMMPGITRSSARLGKECMAWDIKHKDLVVITLALAAFTCYAFSMPECGLPLVLFS